MLSARYEYTQTDDFVEVRQLAADGWRLAGVASAYRGARGGGAVYVMERPAAGREGER